MLQLAPQVIPIILSLINLGNVELLMSIIKLLSGNQQSIRVGGMGWSGGSKSNNRQLQRGGGLKENVLRKLDELAIKFHDKPHVVACIKIIKARIENEPEPAATATAPALDSSDELDSLATELTTDTNITQADKDIVTTQDPALEALVEKDESVTSNTSVNDPLPPAVEEAAKMNIIHTIITFFKERIESGITAKLDGMISKLRGKLRGKDDEDVISCIKTLKTAIVEDIVTQIKNKASSITTKILDTIFRVGGVMASDIITFLLWSSVQIALKNYRAIPIEGAKLIAKRGSQVVGAVAGRFGNLAGSFGDKAGSVMNRMRRNTIPVDDSVSQSPLSESISPAAAPSAAPAQVPAEQQKPGLLSRIGSGFGFGRK